MITLEKTPKVSLRKESDRNKPIPVGEYASTLIGQNNLRGLSLIFRNQFDYLELISKNSLIGLQWHFSKPKYARV